MTREEAIAYLEDPFPLSNSLSIERRLELHDKALSMAIEALKANDYASERYADLCAFFSGHRNKGADILHSREEFEQWLKRMRWHVEECDRLSKELDALKAQMDWDTISRQAAIDVLSLSKEILSRVLDDIDVVGTDREKYSWGIGLIESNINDIEELPSAQPEAHWIPCSERLPSPLEWDEKYLVSLAWGGIGVMEYKSTGFHNYGSFNPVPIETVIAWMLLPDPYKKESGGK